MEIIGTVHTSSQSNTKIKEYIETEEPDIVAVELCEQRYNELVAGNKNNSVKEGNGGLLKLIFVFLFMKVQDYISEKEGLGKNEKDQVMAAKESRKNDCKTVLIDRNIQITLNKFVNEVTIREYAILFGGMILSFIPFVSNNIVSEIEDMEEEDTELMLQNIGKYIPTFYDVIIKERDVYMAANLAKIEKIYPDKKIVAFIGKGHEPGINELLEDREKLKKKMEELEITSELTIIEEVEE